jgi:adenine-specific DNA methylase
MARQQEMFSECSARDIPRRFRDQPNDKLRGGYYTPPEIAAWLAGWAIRFASDNVLEPSSGDGAFLAAVASRLLELGTERQQVLEQISAVEVESTEARKGSLRLKTILGIGPNGAVACDDFFAWREKCHARKYACAVGNPPFIRYQNFPQHSRARAMALMVEKGLKPNRLTNVWVPFVVGATASLRAGGRLAFVLPAELLQVSYAAQLRRFLVDHFARLHIFACNHLVFDDAEQETVLLLADDYTEAANNKCLIEMVETKSLAELLASRPNHKPLRDYVAVDHSTEKWLKYFLTPQEIGLMRALKAHPEIASLASHAEIDVGVVTGRNDFFVLDKHKIAEYQLNHYVVPLIGRSAQLRGAIIDGREWQRLAEAGEDVHLLTLAGPDKPPLNVGAKRYVKFGEAQGFHLGFKCSIRVPWYSMPSLWTPDCFFFRQIYNFPRVVLNHAKAISTDTVHRMRCRRKPASVLQNLYTHLAAASAEIEGRSYGGGVLELEPTEAERLLMPKELRDGVPAAEIDRLVRNGRIDHVLKENDRLILKGLGMTAAECAVVREIWGKMRERRVARRHRAK